MNGMVLYFDEIDKKLEELKKKVMPEAVIEGLGRAGMQVLADAVMITPTVPHDEGTLRGSGSVFVANKLVGTSPKESGQGTPAMDHNESLDASKLQAVIGFNTPYAARWHEVPANFKEPGSGNKYLESKLSQQNDVYMAIISSTVKKKIESS